MKLVRFNKGWNFLVSCCFLLGIAVSNAYSQESQSVCPFADDVVVLYSSPSTIMKGGIDAVKQHGFEKEIKAATVGLEKADVEIKKALNEGLAKEDPNAKKLEYLLSICYRESGINSPTRAVLGTIGKYVDCVILAGEMPENIKNIQKELPNKLTLSFVFNTNPCELDPRKFVEDDKVEIIRENDSEILGKLIIGANEADTLFFGGTKVKDSEKYVVVCSISQELVEKKIDLFKKSNAFIINNLEAGYNYHHLVRPSVFRELVKATDGLEKASDERTRAVFEVLKQIKSFENTVIFKNDSIEQTVSIEGHDSEAAQMISGLALGGLAVLKLAAKNKTDLNPQEQLGSELLSSISVDVESDTFVRGKVRYSYDWIKKVIDLGMKEAAHTGVFDKE